MSELTFTFSVEQLNVIAAHLRRGVYEQVAGVLESIQRQYDAQQIAESSESEELTP